MEWIYEIINFPKNDLKNLKDSCPMYRKNSQGRNPSNFSGHFLEIDDFINSFGFNLTFSKYDATHALSLFVAIYQLDLKRLESTNSLSNFLLILYLFEFNFQKTTENSIVLLQACAHNPTCVDQ